MTAMVIPPSVYEPVALGALKAAVKASGATSDGFYMVPIDNIYVAEDFNIRITGPRYDERVHALADLIEHNGFLRSKPITCFIGADNEFFVTDGHRRLEAARLVNERVEEGKATCPRIDRLPVIVRPNGTTMEGLTYGLVLENTGEPLTPLEIGIAVARLQTYGQEPKAIASKLGFTVKYVNDLLTLNSAVPAIRTLVATGKIAAKTAIEAITEHKGGALKVLRSAVGVAEAAGQSRATPKHVKAVATPAPKVSRKPPVVPPEPVGTEIRPPDTVRPEPETWTLAAGTEVSLESIKPIARIYNADWWELTDKEGEVRILRAIQVSVTREPAPETGTPPPPVRRKRGKASAANGAASDGEV